jgi:hypothetical protein
MQEELFVALLSKNKALLQRPYRKICGKVINRLLLPDRYFGSSTFRWWDP